MSLFTLALLALQTPAEAPPTEAHYTLMTVLTVRIDDTNLAATATTAE